MQFIIVADEDFADLSRQLAHALSLHEEHSGTYWTLKHYEDNEASLAKQPVIFLGDSKVAKSYTEVLPQRFSDYGTTCWFEGAKAVLAVSSRDAVSPDDLAGLQRVVEGRAEEIRHIAETAAVGDFSGSPSGTSESTISAVSGVGPVPLGVRVAVAAQPVVAAGLGVAHLLNNVMTAGRRKRAYLRLQHRYVLDRFLKDEFEAFVSGVDGR